MLWFSRQLMMIESTSVVTIMAPARRTSMELCILRRGDMNS